jgi:DNA polymerase elongation subunit (family B)
LVQIKDAAPAPQEWLALDIETIAKKYINSESKRADYPIGIICTTLKSGERRAFMLGPPVPGATCFDDEADMLRAFYAYVRHVNPDGFITYNGNSFDIPYLTTRSERLGVHECVNITRMPEYKLRIKHTENKTAANGTLKTTLIDCPGRMSLDLYMIGRKTLKLRKYKLAAVAAYYGLEGKEDLSYTDIYPYFYGTVEQRQQLLSYCARDTDLVIEIERKMGAIVQLAAQCKVLRLEPAMRWTGVSGTA